MIAAFKVIGLVLKTYHQLRVREAFTCFCGRGPTENKTGPALQFSPYHSSPFNDFRSLDYSNYYFFVTPIDFAAFY